MVVIQRWSFTRVSLYNYLRLLCVCFLDIENKPVLFYGYIIDSLFKTKHDTFMSRYELTKKDDTDLKLSLSYGVLLVCQS